MKRARIINAIICVAIAITLCVWVSIEWYSLACPASSLIIACATYTAMVACIGATIDQIIKEAQK